jgi:hypothetical protein
VDLKSDYWQVDLHPDDREKTAFSTGQALRQFTVMYFGLCKAPATYERLMETVLGGLTYQSCLVYLDDVIVIGRTFQEHLLNLRKVFQRFRDAHLKLIPEKCQHIVSLEGITSDPGKLKAVREWPTPNKHEIRSFLGLRTYYRRFISGLTNIAKPLSNLTEEKHAFQWTSEIEAAFQTLNKGCPLYWPYSCLPAAQRGVRR